MKAKIILYFLCSLNLIAQTDLRKHQHGLDLIKLKTNHYYLIWASSNKTNSSNWEHDIFYSKINFFAPKITPIKWISGAEAQEPASSAINASGTKIFCTWEDGNNAENIVAQRYFESGIVLNEKPESNYSEASTFRDGGHSGHVAAVGDYFVSTWVEGWTKGGGVDELGSGDEVFLSVVDSSGTIINNNMSVDSGRQWWSEIAGSPSKACIIWQSFVNDEKYANLKMMIYDPKTEKRSSIKTIMNNVLYYHYSIKYIPSIDRFLIIASKDGGLGENDGRKCAGGKAFLVDNNGNIKASQELSEGIIRESQTIVDGNRVAQTQLKNGQSVFGNNSNGGNSGGIMILTLTSSSIKLTQTINDSYKWEYMGNDGFFQNSSTVVVFALSANGVKTKTFTINN